MKETKIYIGLNDSDTKTQKFSTDKYKSLLKKVCYQYHTSFSVSVLEGGYFSADGGFTDETSLTLTLIDVADEIVEDIARDLCAFFHQESVLVTESPVKAVYIHEEL